MQPDAVRAENKPLEYRVILLYALRSKALKKCTSDKCRSFLLLRPVLLWYKEAMARKLYIIDGHAHIYAAYYAPMRQKLTSPAGEPTKATYIFTMALRPYPPSKTRYACCDNGQQNPDL